VTYQCEECGKSLATEGGFEIHMETHRRPVPRPEAAALTVPSPVPVPAQATPMFSAGKATDTSLLFLGLAVTTAVMFLVGMVAAVHPSLIRKTKISTVAAEKAHGVPIPDTSSPTTAASDPAATVPAAPATTAPATTPPTAVQPVASDDTVVQSLVLQAADYGPGWQASDLAGSPFGGMAGPGSFQTDSSDCSGASNLAQPTADTTGPAVSVGNMAAFTMAALFATKSEAAADIASIKDPSLLPCIKSAFVAGVHSAGGAAATATATVERLLLPLAKVDSSGLRFVVTATGPNGTVSVFIDMIMVQAGRAEGVLAIMSIGARTPAAIEQQVAQRLAQKVASAGQVSA